MSNNNQNIPPNVTNELLDIKKPDLDYLTHQKTKLFRYRATNIKDNNKDLQIRENTIKFCELDIVNYDSLECIVRTKSSSTEDKIDSLDGSITRLFSYDTIDVEVVGPINENPNTFYVYSFIEFKNDNVELSNNLFYINLNLTNIYNYDQANDNTTLNLKNFDTWKLAKNSQIVFRETKLNDKDNYVIQRIEFFVPFDTLIGRFNAKGYYTRNGVDYFDNIEFRPTDASPTGETWSSLAIPFKINPFKVGKYVEFYSPWFDYNITLPYSFLKQFRHHDHTSGSQTSIKVVTGISDDTEDVLAQILLYSAMYTSGFRQNDIPINILNAFKAAGDSELQIVIDNLIEEHILKVPDFITSDDYWKLKSLVSALSKYCKSKYAIAGGLNDLNQLYLPWYLELKTELPKSGDSVAAYFNSDGTFKPKSLLLDAKWNSKYFTYIPGKDEIWWVLPEVYNLSLENNINGVDQTYTWSKIDNPLVESRLSTLASDVANANKNYLNYFMWFMVTKNTEDESMAIGNNFFGFIQSKSSKTYNVEYDIQGSISQTSDQTIIQQANIPSGATNINITKNEYQKVVHKNVYTCPIGTTLAPWNNYCYRSAHEGFPASVKVIDQNITWIKGTISYTISNGKDLFDYENYTFSREQWQSLLSKIDPLSFTQGYKKIVIRPINSGLKPIDYIKSLEISGLWGGNFHFDVYYSDVNNINILIKESYGNPNFNDKTSNNINLFDNNDDEVSKTILEF